MLIESKIIGLKIFGSKEIEISAQIKKDESYQVDITFRDYYDDGEIHDLFVINVFNRNIIKMKSIDGCIQELMDDVMCVKGNEYVT